MPQRARDNSELRFSDIASVNPRTPLNGLDPDAPVSFIPMADVDDGGRWATRQTRPLREVKTGYSPFADGDILFAKITPCTENGKGCHARDLTNGVGFGSTEFHVLRAKKGTDPRLVFHLAQSSDVRWKAAAVMDGSAGQQRVPADFFKICRIAPDILDNQDAKCDLFDAVDAAIDATRGVIERTRRLKTAVLQDLLTRGLPGQHSEFREVKGLGQVPRAWKITPLAKLIDSDRPICYGILMPGRGHPGGVPVVKVKDLADGRINLDDILLTTPDLDDEYKRSRLRQGDVLVSIRGTTGRIAFVPAELHNGNITQDTARLSISDKCVRDFVFYCLQTREHQAYIQHHTIGQAVKGINISEVRKIPIPLPGADERQPIVQMLRALDRRVESEQATLAQLTNEKIALSQALLTGRVRVPAAKREMA